MRVWKSLLENEKRAVLFFFLFLFFCRYGACQVVYSGEKIVNPSEIKIFEDKDGKSDLSVILKKKSSFYSLDKTILNLGITNSVYWIKFSLKNLSDQDHLLVVLDKTTLKLAKLFIERDGVIIESENPSPIRKNTFEINIAKKSSVNIYIQVQGFDQLVIPIIIGSENQINEDKLTFNILMGVYIGIMLIMLLYNFFIYISVRDKSYLIYVFYVLFIGTSQVALKGIFNSFTEHDSFIKEHLTYISACLAGIFAIEFLKIFLKTKEHVPLLHKASYFFIIPFLFGIGANVFGFLSFSFLVVQFVSLLGAIYCIYVAIMVLLKGQRSAKLFLIAWTIFLFGVIVFVLKDIGVLPFNKFTDFSLLFSSGLETSLLSFALADRINILKKEKEQSQEEALQMAQENERIIREQNVVLEQKVTERTIELQQSNEELNATLENLKDTQAQLVDSEKMASLGQLTAGIAHEINNPINFVTSNITPLKHDISDIMELLDKYGEIKEPGELERQLKEVEDLKEEIDLEYVKEEIESLLKGIQEGAERTSEIVRGLKNFSRLDEDDLKKADLNEGIDSTLTLLNNKLKDNISVEKKYAISSKVDCYPGKINQLLMNIINNAIHAIEANDTLKPSEGLLTIATEEYEKEVMIKVSDNGVGMDEQTKKKMFDPFYTTKEVGKGTGLGMSIVYKIIQNHKGRIEIESVLGEGTSVIIYLPKVV